MSNVSPLSGSSIEPSPPAGINEAEWRLRQKLALCYRIFDHLDWSLVIFNHLTVRVPGPAHHFLINPFGLRYDEVTASNLVKIDLDGNVVGNDGAARFNFAGFIIHGAIHQNVPDALWIMHTHTRDGIAVSCKRQGLTNTNFYSAMIHDHVAYHDFEGVTFRRDEQERLVSSLGTRPLAVLRNHGLLSHGRTAEEAFMRLWMLQLACETQVTAESMGGETIEVSREATDISTRDAHLFDAEPSTAGDGTFAALERLVTAKDASWQY